MRKYSLIRPCEVSRIPLFLQTHSDWIKNLEGHEFEIIVPTTTITTELDEVLKDLDYKIIRYPYNHKFFNPAKAWNHGIRAAKYANLILASPEMKPSPSTIFQLDECVENNVVCQTFDLHESGAIAMTLVKTGFRDATPSMFFMAMFNKQDLEVINGFDEDFCDGYAYEDDDFGARFVRAGLPFVVRDDIVGYHLWHARGGLGQDGWHNSSLFDKNNKQGIIKPKRGLIYYE